MKKASTEKSYMQRLAKGEKFPAFPPVEEKKPMLHKAEDLINGQRQQDYGDKLQNFAQIAMGFQMVLAAKLAPDSQISPEDVALCMMQVKIARLAKSPDHKDSIMDIAGYAGCYDKLQEEREKRVNLEGGTYDSRYYNLPPTPKLQQP